MAILARSPSLVRERYSVRVHIIAIVFLILVPALILAGSLATWSARSERTQLELNAKNQVREATTAIERDIISTQNMLVTLASSPFLQNENIEGFYGQAADVSRKVGLQLVLHDRSLNQLINTAFPWGTPLIGGRAAPLIEAEEELLRSGKPVVSNVFFGPRVKRYVVTVAVPVFRGGDLEYILAAGVPLTSIAKILGSLDIRADHIVNVVDHNGIFVARSYDNNEFAGTRTKIVIPLAMQGVFTGVNREGSPSHWFYRRSDLLGWTIAVGVPDYFLEAPFKRALAIFAAAGSLLLAVAIALSYYWGGWLAQSVGALGIDRKPTREEFEILFDSAPNGVMVVDNNGRIVLQNAQFEKKFGYMPEELIGKSVDILVPERFRSAHFGLRKAFALDPQPRPMGARRDLYGRRKDGTEFPVEIGLNPINSSAGNLVMITVVDISARKLAAERLSATTAERDDLRRRLIQAQEQERLRLAHELHDQTGQSLTAVMLEMKGIENSVNEPDRSRLRLLRLRLEQVGQTLHHVAWELRPASIDELGLASALADYILEWGEQHGIEADFHCADTNIDAFSEEICTTVYRVVQEALTNVVKHARQATRVSVVIERSDAKLRLTIEDNGCGFDTTASTVPRGSRNGGLGLAGMRERLSLIGGELEVESSVGAGTTIFARIPLERKRTAA